MAWDTFPNYKPSQTSPGFKVSHRSYVAEFGDGFKQVAAAGINTTMTEGSWVWEHLANADADVISAFLTAHGTHEPFWWTHPISAEVMAVRQIQEHEETDMGAMSRNISAVFERWWGAEE